MPGLEAPKFENDDILGCNGVLDGPLREPDLSGTVGPVTGDVTETKGVETAEALKDAVRLTLDCGSTKEEKLADTCVETSSY